MTAARCLSIFMIPITAALTIGIRAQDGQLRLSFTGEIDKRCHFTQERVVVVEGVDFLRVIARSTDIQSRPIIFKSQPSKIPTSISLTRVDELELVSIGKHGKLGGKLCALQRNSVFEMSYCARVVLPRRRGESRDPLVFRDDALVEWDLSG